MLLPDDLHVDVLVVVLVQRGRRQRVADPEVDGVGGLLERDACPGDVLLHVREEGCVFVAEIVVLLESSGGRFAKGGGGGGGSSRV